MSSDHPGSAAAALVPTFFLTAQGTLIRVETATRKLIQARLVPVRGFATDWEMQLPAAGLAAPVTSPVDERLIVTPALSPREVTIRLGDAYLCAEPHSTELSFSRSSAGAWEYFLLLQAHELAALRHVLAHDWTEGPEGAAPEARLKAALLTDFQLAIGDYHCDLRPRFPPFKAGAASIGVSGGGGLRLAGPASTGQEWPLTRRPDTEQAQPVPDAATFNATPEGRLALRGGLEYGLLPLSSGWADDNWMLDKWSQPRGTRLGKRHLACQLVREQDKYVLLTRGQEGLIFDARGASNETGYLMTSHLPRGGILSREGDHPFIDGAAVAAAPHLAGPHAVFYGGHLSNYYHWIIDALLPLSVMAPHLPPGTKLLIPPTLRRFRAAPPEQAVRTVDHMTALREWGFGDWPIAEIDAPLCHVEEVYWLDDCFIEQMPADFLQAARRGMLARLEPRGKTQNIYLRRERTRQVANAEPVEKIAVRNGFAVHEIEGMTVREQMRLFQNADFVIAPHGAAMANLLFCAPGTKVLELSPDCEFRPIFTQISDKLDLVHAVLPCPTDDGGFFGAMQVDTGRFRALLRQLQTRHEPA
jgi:hypothetical protein